jgi:hypothetical protein
VTIHRFLQNTPLDPEDIERLVDAYHQTLRALDLANRDDPMTRMIAKKIIEVGQTGVRDPTQISHLAIRELGLQ